MTGQDAPETFALTTSRGFESWLARSGGSLAFTTYQAGKIFFLGLKGDGNLAVFERTFARCMGLAVSPDARTLLLATHCQLYRFDNALPPGQQADGRDALYVPRVSWITGDLDIDQRRGDRLHTGRVDTSGRAPIQPRHLRYLHTCEGIKG